MTRTGVNLYLLIAASAIVTAAIIVAGVVFL